MSNFWRLDYCKNCVAMTNHTWYDDTPKHYEYTAECGKCKLRTTGKELPQPSEPQTEAKASPSEPLSIQLEEMKPPKDWKWCPKGKSCVHCEFWRSHATKAKPKLGVKENE